MFALKAITKALTIGTTIVSFVAVAETYYDRQFYTASFMDNVEQVNIDINAKAEKRIVASKEKELPLIQKVVMDKAALIDGQWMITKIFQVYEDDENIVFDALNGNDSEVEVDMRLLDISTVRINDDYDQTYMVSLLTESGTIALFKEFGDGYEVVEARRVIEEEKEQKVTEETQEVTEEKSKFDIEEDMYLVSAVDPKRGQGVVKGSQVEGYAYLKNGELIIESAQLHIGSNIQTESLSTEARIKAHGTFNDERGSQGIVTITNEKEIKVRFSTGPLEGAMLNFATYERKNQIEENFQRKEEREAQLREEKEYAQEEIVENDDSEARREKGVGMEIEGANEVFDSGVASNDRLLNDEDLDAEFENRDQGFMQEGSDEYYEEDGYDEYYEDEAYEEQASVSKPSKERLPASTKKVKKGFSFKK